MNETYRNKCYLSKWLFGLIKHGPGYKILSDRFKNQFFLSKQRTALGAVCNLPGRFIFSPLKAFCKDQKVIWGAIIAIYSIFLVKL